MPEQIHNITIHPQGVAAPAKRMVAFVSEAVGTAIRALSNDHCTDQASWGGALAFKFNGLELNPDERRAAFTNWILAKGFQDLARGIRETLEEAYVVVKILTLGQQFTMSPDQLDAHVAKLRADAQKLNFPPLMTHVNAGLNAPLTFEAEFLSLQKARNCLEHRGGRVGAKDVDPGTGKLTLSFPRLKLYYMKNDEEVEVAFGEPIKGDTFDQGQVNIHIRRVTRSREYALNDPVVITFNDFLEIAMACQMFAGDVAMKLAPPAQPSAQTEPAPVQ